MGNPTDPALREMKAQTYIRICKHKRAGWIVRRVKVSAGQYTTISHLYDTYDKALASIGGHR